MSARRHIRAEDGGVLVASAIIIAALVFLSVGIIQVGAWFQDRRHLQVRADAGALAGAQFFNQCFDTAAFTPAQAKANMEKTASQYAGFTSYLGTALAGSFTPAYNIGENSGSNGVLFQSTTYPGGGGDAPDDTNTANECDSGNLALDVKLSRDVGGLFSISPLGHIHAHARVQLKEVKSVVPTFPLAVPELVPDAVGVTFINEDTNTELTGCTGAVVSGTTCTYALANINAGNPGSDPYNLGPWRIASAGVNLPTFSGTTPLVTHVGMRVGVGDLVRSCANSGGNGSSWQCFNNTTLNHGVIMISDVNPAAGIAAPKLQGIFPNTCTGSPFDGDEIAFPNPCYATFGAKIDTTGVANFRLRGSITQTGGTAQTVPNDMTPDGTLAPTDWASVNINPPTGGSEYTVQPCWRTGGSGAGGFNNCPGAWAQRVVGATDNDDGPLASVSLSDPTSPTGPYSYNSGGVKTFTINVTLKAPFNKITILRQSHDGSATAFILCRWKDPNNPAAGYDGGLPGITGALETGCQVPYQVNTAVPPTCTPDPLSAPTSIVNPDCTQNKPSTSMGNQITKSLDTRFGCAKGKDADHPNLWPDYSEPGDPRAVTLVTTTYDAFAKNGNDQYPVTGFGAFYIAGVIGNSCENSDPLDSTEDHWPTELGPEPNKNSGTIWGYFIKYTNLDGTPSGRACKVNSLNNCVAVLTR